MPRLQKEPTPAQLAAREAGAARLRAASAARVGKPRPTRSTRQFHEASEDTVGQDTPRVMASEGPAMYQYDNIQPVERVPPKAKLDALQFNEEFITVLIHDSTNPHDEPVPYVINGGRRQAFMRGQEQKVRRKFVEVLARMKVTTYTQEKFKDSQGIDAIRNIPHTAHRWPFTIIEDRNPRGKAWITAVNNEA